MNQFTRKVLSAAALAGALSATVMASWAAGYPDRPITIVVPYGAGGTTDISARKLASMAESELGQSIVVENHPGGSGTNAMRLVAGAVTDGYTLIAATSSPLFVTPAVRDVGYDPVNDFTPVLNYSGPYHGVLVNAKSPYKTLNDLVEASKKNTTISYGTAGAMGGAHLAFVAVEKATGAKLKHVPFKGSAAATAALLGEHVDVALVPAYRDLVKDGQLRLLAVLDGTEDPDFSETPTLMEAGYDVEFPSVVGVLAPKGTDAVIMKKLEAVFTQIASSSAFKEEMNKLNQPVRIMTGDELAQTISRNLAVYKEVAKGLSEAK